MTATMKTPPRARSASWRSVTSSPRRRPGSNRAPAFAGATIAPSCRLLPRQLHRGLDIHFHDPRDAGLGHGHAHELLRELHGDLVVRDEEELRLRRHLAHQL